MVGPHDRQPGCAVDLDECRAGGRQAGAARRRARAASSHQSGARRSVADSIAEKSSRSSTSRPEPRRLGGDAAEEALLGLAVPGDVGREQARGVAADRGQRRAQLVAQAREEAALELLRAAQRRRPPGGRARTPGARGRGAASWRRPRAAPSRRRRRAPRSSARAARSGRAGAGKVTARRSGPGRRPARSRGARPSRRAMAPARARATLEQLGAAGPTACRGRRRSRATLGAPAVAGGQQGRPRRPAGPTHSACEHDGQPLARAAPARRASRAPPGSSRARGCARSPRRAAARARPRWRRSRRRAVTRSSSSRGGCPRRARKTVITPIRPPAPMTGTAHELPIAGRRRPAARHGAHAALVRTSWSTTVLLAGRRPARPGRRRRPNGSSAQASRSAGGQAELRRPARRLGPSTQVDGTAARCRARPRASRGSASRLEDGSAEARRSARPCRRLSWRRAEESVCWPEISARTSSGWDSAGSHVGDDAAVAQDDDAVGEPEHLVDVVRGEQDGRAAARARSAVSSSTWADSLTPSDAVGSSRISSRGSSLIARATARSWRWPPESELTAPRGVGQRDAEVARAASAARRWKRVAERSSPARSWPSSRLAAMSRLSHRARSCQTTATPRRDGVDRARRWRAPRR